MHALLIGIDTYKYPTHRCVGAVADADFMRDFLQNDFACHPSRITVLKDGVATRDRITEAIRNMATDEIIMAGQPILIYFSGLTLRVFENQHERYHYFIMTHDRKAISSHELSALLSNLMKEKGGNIVSNAPA